MLSEEHRLALAIAVYEKKDILFGKLAPGITMKVRASAWMQIMGQLNALGARIEKIDDIRDTAWSYMKKKAKERFLVR
jgi:predicted HTH domain antitoxin